MRSHKLAFEDRIVIEHNLFQNEIWKEIIGYKNYSVSSCGMVKNNLTGRILSIKCKKDGYISVVLTNDRKKSFQIHRLVAQHFIDNPDNKPTVNHKNGKKSDNRMENLEWLTMKEQNLHSHKIKPRLDFHSTARGVWRIDKNTNLKVEHYSSIKFAADWVLKNLDKKAAGSHISAVALGRKNKKGYLIKTTYGFKWEFDQIRKIEEEVWKDLTCVGKPYFKISNCGRIINRTGRILKQKAHPDGYTRVKIGKTSYSLHRLVAKEFVPNLKNKPFVNHIDGNKNNSKSSNLEWVTEKENSVHAANNGLIKLRKVNQLSLDGKLVNTFKNCKDASRNTKITRIGIWRCCAGKQRNCAGYQWEYQIKNG